METINDPFAKLFITEEQDPQEIIDFLYEYLRINPDNFDIRFAEHPKIPIRHRILLFLLTLHILVHFGKLQNKKATPRQIVSALNSYGGTIRPILRTVYKQRLINREAMMSSGRKDARYWIPSNKIRNVMRYIKND